MDATDFAPGKFLDLCLKSMSDRLLTWTRMLDPVVPGTFDYSGCL